MQDARNFCALLTDLKIDQMSVYRFENLLDNAKRFEVEDGTFAAPGAVGLATLADSVVQFDAFSVARSR